VTEPFGRACDSCAAPSPGGIYIGGQDTALCEPCYRQRVSRQCAGTEQRPAHRRLVEHPAPVTAAATHRELPAGPAATVVDEQTEPQAGRPAPPVR